MQMYWSKQEVDCSGWMLRNISWALVDLPGLTLSLNLSRNKISQLKERQFEELPQLEKLFLQRNSLKTVVPGAFIGVGNLTQLDLSSNSIGNLSIGSFKGLKKLIILNLENNCLCCIFKDVFYHLFSLRNLILSRNKLSEVANVFQALTDLSTLDSLDISQNGITNFSVEVEVKIKRLVLCRNNISKLEFSSRFFPYLQKFDFCQNKIEHMSDDLFRNFTSLTSLVLNNNPLNISVLKHSGLLKLDELYVSNLAISSSSLSELCDFSRRVKLRKLIANYNQITTIDSEKLANCSHLKSLSISDNRIKSLVKEEFKHTINMQALYLGFNHIIRIANTTWQNLKNLTKLRVNGNNFEVVEYLFSPLSRLENLDLGRNKISNIPTTAFLNLNNLKYLNLDYNQIHDINGAWFKDLRSLKTLEFD
uniref:toll-like receptor 13 n=1 Tax=Myxine glutinosa TaxID=7769 RepID=UPI00358F0F19